MKANNANFRRTTYKKKPCNPFDLILTRPVLKNLFNFYRKTENDILQLHQSITDQRILAALVKFSIDQTIDTCYM